MLIFDYKGGDHEGDDIAEFKNLIDACSSATSVFP